MRYATLASPTLRTAYEEAVGKLRPRIAVAPAGRPPVWTTLGGDAVGRGRDSSFRMSPADATAEFASNSADTLE